MNTHANLAGIESLRSADPSTKEELAELADQLSAISLPPVLGSSPIMTEYVQAQCISSPSNTTAVVYKIGIRGRSFCLKMDHGDRPKALKEADYLKRHSYLGFMPRVFLAGRTGTSEYYAMQFLDGRLLDALWHESPDREGYVCQVIQQLMQIPHRPLPRSTQSLLLGSLCTTRLAERFQTLEQSEFGRLLELESIVVNDQSCRSIRSLLAEDYPCSRMLPFTAGGAFPGDVHFGNVLADGKQLWFVDPKGCYLLPIEYDLGKVLCTIHGRYDQIVRGQFRITKLGEGRFEFLCPAGDERSETEFQHQVCSHFGDHGVECSYLMELVHFIALLPHHRSNTERILALYLRTLQLANELESLFGR